MSAIHIPALRFGVPYRSVDTLSTTGAQVSQVNSGLIRRDMLRIADAAAELQDIPSKRLLAICHDAGEFFLSGRVPVGDAGQEQTADDYVRQTSASCGLPHALVRNNMGKIAHVLLEMGAILKGLTRGLDLSVLDAGMGEQQGVPVSFYRTADSLGVVLPSNSPGVNSLWIPAIALKVPVALKPGRDDPWTPYRIAQSLIAAGCPRSALSFYPTSHEGAHALLAAAGRSLLFGDASITKRYAGDPRVELHGPGYSKVLIGADSAEDEHDAGQSHVAPRDRRATGDGGRGGCRGGSGRGNGDRVAPRERLRVRPVTRAAGRLCIAQRRQETDVRRRLVFALRITAMADRAEVAEGVVAVPGGRGREHRLRAAHLVTVAALRGRSAALRTSFERDREGDADEERETSARAAAVRQRPTARLRGGLVQDASEVGVSHGPGECNRRTDRRGGAKGTAAPRR